MPGSNRFVVLARITQPHGVRGAVKLRCYAQSPEQLFAYGALQDALGTSYALRQIGQAKDQLICEIDGVSYRDEAEKLKGLELGLPREKLPESTEEDECYIDDLIGLCVQLENGEAIGTIKAVHNFGAGDILEITTPQGDEMYSFTQANFPEVDLERGFIVLNPPEILKGGAP